MKKVVIAILALSLTGIADAAITGSDPMPCQVSNMHYCGGGHSGLKK